MRGPVSKPVVKLHFGDRYPPSLRGVRSAVCRRRWVVPRAAASPHWVAELFWFSGPQNGICAVCDEGSEAGERQVQRGNLIAAKVPLAPSGPLSEQPGEQAGSHAVNVFRVTSQVPVARGG